MERIGSRTLTPKQRTASRLYFVSASSGIIASTSSSDSSSITAFRLGSISRILM